MWQLAEVDEGVCMFDISVNWFKVSQIDVRVLQKNNPLDSQILKIICSECLGHYL